MSIRFIMTRDANGYNGFGLLPPEDAWQTTLAPSAEQHFKIPSNSEDWIAIFSFTPGSSIWVSIGNTATLPGSSFSSTLSELNPAARQVQGGQIISVITSDATSPGVGVSLYTLG